MTDADVPMFSEDIRVTKSPPPHLLGKADLFGPVLVVEGRLVVEKAIQESRVLAEEEEGMSDDDVEASEIFWRSFRPRADLPLALMMTA